MNTDDGYQESSGGDEGSKSSGGGGILKLFLGILPGPGPVRKKKINREMNRLPVRVRR